MTEAWIDSLQSADATISYHNPLPREERIKEAAMHHARLLQERKDTEWQILESLENLIDYPTQANSDATHPSAADITHVKQMLIPFQPSDYDALIEERNINRKCGYLLCPNPNKLQGTNAKFGFLHSKGQGSRIVDRKVLECWCSPECGRRALYLRVQLAEEPAWERAGGVGGDFVLFDEGLNSRPFIDLTSQIAERLGKLDVRDDEERLVAAMSELAVERGDGSARGNSTRLVNVHVVENTQCEQDGQALIRLQQPIMGAFDEIEGYRPRKVGEKYQAESPS